MKAEHQEKLKVAVEAILAANPTLVEKYETGDFQRADAVIDLQNRFAWAVLDLLIDNEQKLMFEVFSEYPDSETIEAAVLKFVPKITRKY